MRVGVSNRVIARSSIGRFIAECEEAATATVKEAIREGAQLSRDFAPEGTKADPRTIPLSESIQEEMTGRTSGHWIATARHALPIEEGAAAHVIAGDPGLKFYWEEAGRMFIPAEIYYQQPGLTTIVNHPGNAAQPYLRPAYEVVMQRIMDIADQKYPG